MHDYKIEVDWTKTGTWVDITEDVLFDDKVRYVRGRDSELDYCVAGTMDFYVDNPTGAYTPGNAAFPTYPSLVLRIPIRLSSLVPSEYLWQGYITQITPRPSDDQDKCYMECHDAMSLFSRVSVSSGIVADSFYYSELTGALFGLLLDDYGWAGGRAIDTGDVTCTMAWWYKQKLTDVAKFILNCEDCCYASMFFLDHNGNATYHDSSHRSGSASLHTFTDDEIIDFPYKVSDKNLCEQVVLTGHKRGWPAWSTIWGSGERIAVPGLSTIAIVAELGHPGYLDDDPVAVTDWRATDEDLYWHGDHTGADNAATLTDSKQNWVTNSLVGYRVYNITDGSTGYITANTATKITAVLSGGTADDWDTGDLYYVAGGDNTGDVAITCPTADATSESISIKITNSQTYTVWIIPGNKDPDKAITLTGRLASDDSFVVEDKLSASPAGDLKVDQKFQGDRATMQAMSTALLSELSEPSLDQIRLKISNGGYFLHAFIMTLELGDKISVNSAKLGVANDFFIEQMSHEFDQYDHAVEYLLSQHGG